MNQSEIENEVRQTLKKIHKIDAERAREIAYLKYVQSLCSHPIIESGNDMGRWSYTRCEVCTKEW